MKASDVQDELQKYASDHDALFLQRFFKTGEGQYGYGDVFIGVRVPQTRKVCNEFKDLPLIEIQKLLDSEIHEHRLAGLIIMTLQYPKADQSVQQDIYDLYLKNIYKGRINNWDLVDLSADKIMGAHLYDQPRDILFRLAKSDKLWERRVSILTTFGFIKRGDPSTTIEIAEVLLHDTEDLIQKAVGWMLREVGKRCDETILTDFLDQHAHNMPRTALRYSIERLNPETRRHYMSLKDTVK